MKRTFLLTLTLAFVFARLAPANLITNGSFEMQAYPGDGDIYSTDPAFHLPGWNYPTGGNQFFLEFGKPFGIARYLDGRQAVCLNGDGIPISLSQIFSTVVGASYTLSFGLAEEQLLRPSPTSVQVDVAGVSRIFDLGANPGYALESLTFKAVSTRTTLSFTDLTTGGIFDSPFIDAVSVEGRSNNVPESGATFPLSCLSIGALALFRTFQARRDLACSNEKGRRMTIKTL